MTDEEILRIAAKTIEPYETSGIAVGEYEEETQRAIHVYGSELIAIARAIAAELRGQEAPAQPEPQGLTDEQLIAAAEQAGLCYPVCWDLRGKDAPRLHHLRGFARAIAAELRGQEGSND